MTWITIAVECGRLLVYTNNCIKQAIKVAVLLGRAVDELDDMDVGQDL